MSKVIGELASVNDISRLDISISDIPLSVTKSEKSPIHCIITHRIYVKTGGNPLILPPNTTFIDD